MSPSELNSLVSQAFVGVELGDGIGLYEAQAIDNYAIADDVARARDQDIVSDWQELDDSELLANQSSLHFFDAAGMRFHLPAFMLAALNRDYYETLIFVLTYIDSNVDGNVAYTMDQFSLIDSGQRRAVRSFLTFMKGTSEYACDQKEIDAALLGYWLGDTAPPIIQV